MNKRERGNNKFLTAVVILLIITIGILLLLLLWPIRKVRIPTGRVDEFDIQINGICKNRNDDSCFGGGDDDGSQDTSSDRGVYYAEEKKINGKTSKVNNDWKRSENDLDSFDLSEGKNDKWFILMIETKPL